MLLVTFIFFQISLKYFTHTKKKDIGDIDASHKKRSPDCEPVPGSISRACGSRWISRAFRSRSHHGMKRGEGEGKKAEEHSLGGCIEIGMRCAPGAPREKEREKDRTAKRAHKHGDGPAAMQCRYELHPRFIFLSPSIFLALPCVKTYCVNKYSV